MPIPYLGDHRDSQDNSYTNRMRHFPEAVGEACPPKWLYTPAPTSARQILTRPHQHDRLRCRSIPARLNAS